MPAAQSPLTPTNGERRGACPSLAVPMLTGDGLLARLRPEGLAFSPAALAGLAKAAAQWGNGIIEITARGSVQVRGLRPETIEPFAQALDAAGIAAAGGVPIEISPLSGMDPDELIDAGPIREHLQRRVADLVGQLAPKVSVVIDGGGAIGLGALKADLRLTALDAQSFALHVGEVPLGTVAVSDAVARVEVLLRELAGMGARARGTDLRQGQPQPRAGRRHGPGRLVLADGSLALIVGLPFGQVGAEALAGFAQAAPAGLRPAPHQTLIVTGLSEADALRLSGLADALGLVTRADDPRRAIAACPGAPACASGRFATRDAAEALAPLLAGFGTESVGIHVSGCAKGCAHPAPAPLTLSGQEGGIGVIVSGLAGDSAEIVLPQAELSPAMARLAGLLHDNRAQGESLAALLARLGPARIAERLLTDGP
jgi:precorrin-3B synthase